MPLDQPIDIDGSFVSRDCRRAKASNRWVSDAARCAEVIAASRYLSMPSVRPAAYPHPDQIEPADDTGQQIVEIMRDAAGELPDGLHLL